MVALKKIVLITLLTCVSMLLCAQVPQIASVIPKSGPIGTLIKITGTNFSNPVSFSIGATKGLVISNDGNTLVGMVMPGTSSGTISVTTPGGIVSQGIYMVKDPVLAMAQQEQKLVPSDIIGKAEFGSYTAISADGNTALIGGPAENNWSGAVWIYIRNGNNWIEQTKLINPGAAGANFGAALDISADGNTIIIGASRDNNNIGAAYVYVRTGVNWAQQSKLVGSGYAGKSNQGNSVAISADGNVALISGVGDFDASVPATIGAGWFFRRNENTWLQEGTKVTHAATNGLGVAAALSSDGRTALLTDQSRGFVFVYKNGAWIPEGFPLTDNGTLIFASDAALSADGRFALIGGGGSYSQGNKHYDEIIGGFVFERVNGVWLGPSKLLTNNNVGNAFVGVDLSADGSVAVVGAGDGTTQDSVWVYQRQGWNWDNLQSKLHGSYAISNAFQVNCKISSDGQTIVVGGNADDNHIGAFWTYGDGEVKLYEVSTTNITYKSFTANWDYTPSKPNEHLELWISGDVSLYNSIKYDLAQTERSFTVLGLYPSKTYYWAVRLVDEPDPGVKLTDFLQIECVTTLSNPSPDNTRIFGITNQATEENDGGSVFSIQADGSSFLGGHGAGTGTFGVIQASDGYLYTLDEDGVFSYIFKSRPDGLQSAYEFITIDSYLGLGTLDGMMIEASDGNFYGTLYGGPSQIYRLSKQGILEIVFDFPDALQGSPRGHLTEGKDGYLYGVALKADNSIWPDNKSFIYKVKKDGSGYSILYSFPTISDKPNHYTRGSFVKDSNGDLYGKFYFADVNKARIVKITNGVGVSVLATLPGIDDVDDNGLLIGSDGYLYGTTLTPGSNSLFKIAKDGSGYSTLYTFPEVPGSTSPNPNGAVPVGPLLEYKGKLYGACFSNGPTLANAGTLYSINLDGTDFTLLYSFNNHTNNGPLTPLMIFDLNALDTSNITLTASTATSKRNTEVLVPITVQNFKNILSSQFEIAWDPAVASFVDVENFGLNGMDQNSFGISQVSSGKIIISWIEPGLVPQNLANASSLFSIRFKLTGDYGSSTTININNIELIEAGVPDYHQADNVASLSGTLSIDPVISLNGKVLYSNTEAIQNVQLNCSGSSSQNVSTNNTGDYNFTIAPSSLNESYTVTPSKNSDPGQLNGIDVEDVALIRRHILQTELLTTPYQLIAADVNQNKSISTLDILYVQALILGKATSFPNNALWTFVPANYVFNNPLNPFNYPVNKTVTLAELEAFPSVDFTAIKLGDVNDSRDNSQAGRISSNEVVTFDILQEKVISEDETEKFIEIPVRVKDFNAISGYQFTISWDVDKLEYVKAENKMTQSVFGNQRTDSGALTVLWDDVNGTSTTLRDNDQLLALKFKSTNGGGYEDLDINSSITEAKIYNSSLSRISYTVTKTEIEKSEPNLFTGVYPNPFTDILNLRFYSGENDLAKIKVTDVTGRAVFNASVTTTKGLNEWQWTGTDANGNIQRAGVYVVQLQTSNGLERMKVVKR